MVSFGDHVEEVDRFGSTSVQHRVADLHDAFVDPDVAVVLSAIGGIHTNQLLPHLDWDLIAQHPKIVCGYSDITALTCAINARTGLVTYSGPHYSTFAMRDHLGQTLDWFRAALWSEEPIVVQPAGTWTDDRWHEDQDNRRVRPNDGYWTIAPGHAEGRLVGGNLLVMSLLHGTGYLPDLRGAVVFIEDDADSGTFLFGPQLTQLAQQPGFDEVRGLMIGRFQAGFEMTRDQLEAIIRARPELDDIPIVANVDFGHTSPLLTIPVGGIATIHAEPGDSVQLTLGPPQADPPSQADGPPAPT